MFLMLFSSLLSFDESTTSAHWNFYSQPLLCYRSGWEQSLCRGCPPPTAFHKGVARPNFLGSKPPSGRSCRQQKQQTPKTAAVVAATATTTCGGEADEMGAKICISEQLPGVFVIMNRSPVKNRSYQSYLMVFRRYA